MFHTFLINFHLKFWVEKKFIFCLMMDKGLVVARSIIGWLIGALWLREASSGG
jgi:hypothetical protein